MCYDKTMKKQPASPEQLKARLELRRSNASGTHKNKKSYTRKAKHKGKSFD
jgi:stalled ribosome alternative rescue factor ArfA